MTLARMRYVKALCAIAILVSINVLPTVRAGSSPAKISFELFPQNPYNAFYIGSDLTITVSMRNSGDKGGDAELNLVSLPPGFSAVGRDGIQLPYIFSIPGKGENEDVYYSIALVTSDNAKSGDVEFNLINPDNNELVVDENLSLNMIVPKLSPENLISKAQELGPPDNVLILCIPKYRRYWHLEFNEIDNADLGYVWLLVGENGNKLIDDNTEGILLENSSLPWKIGASEYGEARLWSGNGFENVQVPTVKAVGDNNFDFRRFELYYANWDGNPSWVTRQIFYWTQYNKGIGEEVPDTERVELWLSAETGENLITISDYHFSAFRYVPVDSYTIIDIWHCPLPSDIDEQTWFDFVVADYENVYPMSNIPYDHQGFSTDVHPGSEVLRHYLPLVERNSLGLVIVGILYLVPEVHKLRKQRISRSKAKKRPIKS
jgi:hypothetical protein